MIGLTQVRYLALLWSGMLTVPCLVGCGSNSGPERYHVSGTVTYKGEPVPFGQVLFEPDKAKNNSGPATVATITDGSFTTKTGRGKGAVSGPSIVRITGFDGNPPPGGGTQPNGAPLFKQFTQKVELPEEPSTHDFEIPTEK